jgi:hypothetical protein
MAVKPWRQRRPIKRRWCTGHGDAQSPTRVLNRVNPNSNYRLCTWRVLLLFESFERAVEFQGLQSFDGWIGRHRHRLRRGGGSVVIPRTPHIAVRRGLKCQWLGRSPDADLVRSRGST